MKTMLKDVLLAAFALALCAAPAAAEDVKAGDLVISQAWSRATPGGAKVAGGYLTIENKGDNGGQAGQRFRRHRGEDRGS
ncbi:copper(I)-binding protein [Bradyrhizobium sp. S3.14.4]